MLELKNVNVELISLSEERIAMDYKKYHEIIYCQQCPFQFSIKNINDFFTPKKFKSKHNYYCWLLKLNKENAKKLLEIEKKIINNLSHRLSFQPSDIKFFSHRDNEKYISIKLTHTKSSETLSSRFNSRFYYNNVSVSRDMGNHRRFHLVEDVLKIIKPSSYVDLILSFDFINKTKKDIQ